jgi:hypothetical protein
MEEILISFKTAKLAKELGFDEPCDYKYGNIENEDVLIYFAMHKEHPIETGHINSTCTGCSAPTQSLLQKWLRETHNIMFVIKPFYDNSMKKTTYVADPIIAGKTTKIAKKDTYEEALEVGLFEALNVLKSENL